MSKVIDLINYWKESGRDFGMGVGIFLDYGRNNQSIRSFLLKSKARGKNVPQKARNRLDSEIQMIYHRYIGSYINSSEKAEEKELIKDAAKEVIKIRELAEDELALLGNIQNPYAAVSDAELLIYDRRQLGTKRAMLTNQLEKDGGDEKIIAANLEILAKIEPIVDQMKFIEKRLKDLENKTEEVEQSKEDKPKNEKAIILRIGSASNFRQYSYGDLVSMTLGQVKDLRKKVRDAKSKSKQKADPKNPRVKNKATRIRHEKEYAIKAKELELINIIISHKEKQN